jgi:2-succinyl-5-enolpyruvyl-6-hydroxy-3-cyclohexene-1-carboxylate synthase
MSKNKKEKTEAPQEDVEPIVTDVNQQQIDVQKLVEMYNLTVNQLNQHKQLCQQYELTMNTLTGRLIECQRNLDGVQLQLNQLSAQLTQKGGE